MALGARQAQLTRAFGAPRRHGRQRQLSGHIQCTAIVSRREGLLVGLLTAAVLQPRMCAAQEGAKQFTSLDSGLKVLDIREGSGATPKQGDKVCAAASGQVDRPAWQCAATVTLCVVLCNWQNRLHGQGHSCESSHAHLADNAPWPCDNPEPEVPSSGQVILP